MQVSAHAHSIPVPPGAFMALRPPSIFFVIAGNEAAFVDTGWGDDPTVDARLDYLKEQGVSRCLYSIISHHHADHLGGAERLKEATGARIVAHTVEAPFANDNLKTAKVDITVDDGAILQVGEAAVEVIHTPGHAPGLICLFLREEGVLFSGDHILGLGTTAIGPPLGDMAQYIESLRKLLNYDIKVICPGHGPLIREPRRKIEELIAHRIDRENQVLGLLGGGKHTIAAMVGDIYPELDSRLLGAAQGQVRAHLVKLQREGKITAEEKEGEEGRYFLK